MPCLDSSFLFYDVELGLSGEVETVLLCLHRGYAAFRSLAAPASIRRLKVQIFSPANNNGAIAIHLNDGLVWRLPRLQAEELASLLVRHTLAQVCSHFLLHAGSLSWLGQGIGLAGDSGAGKTTLTLALQQRGFAFLSDETAALERESGILHPFPRRPHRRPGVGFESGPTGDPAEMPPVGEAVPLRHLFLLDHSNPQSPNRPAQRQIVVLCDWLDPALLPSLEESAGLYGVQATTCLGLPAFAYASHLAALPFAEIERLCTAHGCTVLDVVESPAPADFSRPPRLQKLSTSQAALVALGHLQNGYRSRLFRTVYGGQPTALYTGLAQALRHVQCYRLRPGNLEETVELICATVG